LPPAPAFPTIEIDPEKLRLAINPSVTIDTQRYGRLMIESKQRETDQRIRSELAKVPQPITVPGLHR